MLKNGLLTEESTRLLLLWTFVQVITNLIINLIVSIILIQSLISRTNVSTKYELVNCDSTKVTGPH